MNIKQNLHVNKININLEYNKVIKRNMLTRAKNFVQTTSQKITLIGKKPVFTKPYSTQTPVKFKPGSQASKELAGDGSGKHTHLLKETCEEKNCEAKTCPSLCKTPLCVETDGHFTHKPIVGKSSRFVGDIDIKGKPQKQYYTKNSDKSKKTCPQKLAKFKTKKEIKTDTDAETYLKSPDVANQFNQ